MPIIPTKLPALGVLLSGLLLGCTVPPSSKQVSFGNPMGNPMGNPSAGNNRAGCARLRAANRLGSLSFSALRGGPLGETWDFDIFPQDVNSPEPFAWLCGKFWIPAANTEPANGTLEVLISPPAYQTLQEAIVAADFFTLPASINTSDASVSVSATLSGSRYIIEGIRAGQTYRVTFDAPAAQHNYSELARFHALWNAFNALLPDQLQIELVPR